MTHFLALLLAIMLAGCTTIPASPALPAPAPLCGKLETILKTLMKDRGLAYLADAVDSHQQVHMWFISPGNGAWVQIFVSEELEACIEMEGEDWHFAAAR